MIISELLGGFGNQLFQFAHGYALSQKMKSKLYLDVRQFRQYNLRKFDLNYFSHNARILDKGNSLRVQSPTSMIYCSPSFGLKKLDIVKEEGLAFNEIPLDKKKIFIQGFWQSENYFKEYKPDIVRIFSTPDSLKTPEFLKWQTLIERESDPVFVHVRRGDYVSNPETRKVHYVCSENYYRSAFDRVQDEIKKPAFFFFSDDISWVKEHLACPTNSQFVSSPALNAISEFFLMKACKHSIISNSTFSWWATWLRDDEGLVVTPEKWFNVDEMNVIQIIPKRWCKIGIG